MRGTQESRAASCHSLEERDNKVGRILNPQSIRGGHFQGLQPLLPDPREILSSLPCFLALCHRPVAHTLLEVVGALELGLGVSCRMYTIPRFVWSQVARCPPYPRSHMPTHMLMVLLTLYWLQSLLWEGGWLCFNEQFLHK